ncbi:putative integral membrane protein [Variovorax boronicumulans]|uniref:hypothetical protein n=1 Tax=Variovorax boronicumulans TaxID=436515 RepID=UPI002476A604|nr:hypothetical protein [Variovorax boronicumulans]MDH6166424.1 putative integral membrane protein [Variovorax boronicumulans]
MKFALRLLLSYLVASFVMAVVSTVFFPSHAHVPVIVVLLVFPLLPLLALKGLLTVGAAWRGVLPLAVFAVLFGGMAWLAFRARVRDRSKAAARP